MDMDAVNRPALASNHVLILDLGKYRRGDAGDFHCSADHLIQPP